MDTDILGGVQLEYKTILVLSGGTREQDLKNYAFKPDLVAPSLGHLTASAIEHHFYSRGV
jgi:NagD protein